MLEGERRSTARTERPRRDGAQDPPNATLSVLGGRAVEDTVLELSRPRLGDDLVYDARILAGKPPERAGPASLFIDADTNVVVPGLFARPELRRPFAWGTYVYDPDDSHPHPDRIESRESKDVESLHGETGA